MKRIMVPVAVAAVLALACSLPAAAGNTNGRSGTMPAMYDGQIFTMNLMELSDAAAGKIIQNNPASEEFFVAGGFITVLGAIQGDGFNALWHEFDIQWNAGTTPHQFQSDDEVFAAQAAGQITLIDTGELYRCSVIGPK